MCCAKFGDDSRRGASARGARGRRDHCSRFRGGRPSWNFYLWRWRRADRHDGSRSASGGRRTRSRDRGWWHRGRSRYSCRVRAWCERRSNWHCISWVSRSNGPGSLSPGPASSCRRGHPADASLHRTSGARFAQSADSAEALEFPVQLSLIQGLVKANSERRARRLSASLGGPSRTADPRPTRRTAHRNVRGGVSESIADNWRKSEFRASR
jgi:hypothetical protein